MTEEKQSIPDYVVRLDAERRREIDVVKVKMEEFLKSQIEMKHSVDMVSEGQKQLKERFESGTANTLKELKASFDAFRVEWGEKKSEDKSRDKAIETAQKTADDARDDFRKYLLWPVISICLTIIVIVIGYVFKHGGL